MWREKNRLQGPERGFADPKTKKKRKKKKISTPKFGTKNS